MISHVRLLVADDDAPVRRAIANAMSRAGFHVVAAADGGAALALAESSAPDLAIIDYNMLPSGALVVHRLRELYGSAIWIAVISGQSDDAMRSESLRAGADDVLDKPLTISELKDRLIAAVDKQHPHIAARIARERAERRIAYGTEAATMLAHDLGPGLTAALANLSEVAESSSVQTLRRMAALVANFVDIARFEDAAVKPLVAPVNVRALVDAVLATLDTCAVHPEVVCAPDLVGAFDAALIERVLYNLLGTAMRSGGACGTLRLTARAIAKDEPGAVEIGVHIGAGGKRAVDLHFCRLACEAHGGSIHSIGSEHGEAFVIRLPGRR